MCPCEKVTLRFLSTFKNKITQMKPFLMLFQLLLHKHIYCMFSIKSFIINYFLTFYYTSLECKRGNKIVKT